MLTLTSDVSEQFALRFYFSRSNQTHREPTYMEAKPAGSRTSSKQADDWPDFPRHVCKWLVYQNQFSLTASSIELWIILRPLEMEMIISKPQ